MSHEVHRGTESVVRRQYIHRFRGNGKQIHPLCHIGHNVFLGQHYPLALAGGARCEHDGGEAIPVYPVVVERIVAGIITLPAPAYYVKKLDGSIDFGPAHTYQGPDIWYLVSDLADLILDVPAVYYVLTLGEIYDTCDLIRRQILVYRNYNSSDGHEAEIRADPLV